MSDVVCWKCMRLPVTAPGEECRMCSEGWVSPTAKPGPKVKPLDEWSLQDLIDTQESGEVPGQRSWEDNENPIGFDIANLPNK